MSQIDRADTKVNARSELLLCQRRFEIMPTRGQATDLTLLVAVSNRCSRLTPSSLLIKASVLRSGETAKSSMFHLIASERNVTFFVARSTYASRRNSESRSVVK